MSGRPWVVLERGVTQAHAVDATNMLTLCGLHVPSYAHRLASKPTDVASCQQCLLADAYAFRSARGRRP